MHWGRTHVNRHKHLKRTHAKWYKQIKQNSPTKLFFSPTLSLFRQVGSLFRQVGSLIRQSVRSQVSGSPLESRDLIAPLHHCRFRQPNLKLLSLFAQLERNAWQILAAVCSGGTLSESSTSPFQVDDRMSCNGWHGRAARQSRVRIPATD